MKGSMEEILRFVEQNDAFSIISHVAPDGDTIGSGTALSRILRRLGKRTENVCCDQVPDAYKFIPGAEEILLPEDATVTSISVIPAAISFHLSTTCAVVRVLFLIRSAVRVALEPLMDTE